MKTIYILLFLLGLSSLAMGQQLALQSQYMMNKFTINPAFAGTQKGIPIHIGVRRQWSAIKEAPATQYLSSNFNLGGGLGAGITLYNEASGPTRRTGLGLAGAYQFTLFKSGENHHQLSLGASGILSQHALDKKKLETYLPDDPTIIAAYENQLLPDATFGAYYHNADKYFLALSISNLIQTKTDIYNIANDVKNNFVRNYYLMAGYNIDVSDILTIQPSFLVQAIEALPMQFDINTRLIYENKYWVGASYRHQDAIVAMFGLNYSRIEFGYSYDVTISNIKTYSNGSHELHLTYRIAPRNGIKGGKRGNRFF
jgi:type IX secretion system PorP/SprF family membrane protein